MLNAELFKQHNWKLLGQQNADQRESEHCLAETWEDFKPRVIS